MHLVDRMFTEIIQSGSFVSITPGVASTTEESS